MIGIASTTVSTGRKLSSAIPAIVAVTPPNPTRRPTAQSPTSTASKAPFAVVRLVQFSTAVRRNPARMAPVKPKIISWLCQPMPSSPGSPVNAAS